MMDPMMVEIMRNKTPAERLAIACGMWESARVIIGGTVRGQRLARPSPPVPKE